ncbi:DUF6712 family protein [Prevotella sp. MA2016]|uniref:DUF6712 family protein n=1 Tax=Prevotella sp. MA2016 TaxID=1408310 RepID=UPI000491F574|nr:DUF6712 family protein [Prevotella sp. MA2016]
MNTIITEEKLRSLIPHVLPSVEGEPSLEDTLAPYITTAEEWAHENYVPADLQLSEAATDIFEKIVVYHAFLSAIPSLDLILTPNGFGIVNTPTIAPASRERIERLQHSIEALRDANVEQLLHRLASIEAWQQSVPGKYFASTLFPNFHLCRRLNINDQLWQKFQSLHARLIKIENVLAETYFSHEQMDIFRHHTLTNFRYATAIEEQVIKALQSYELQLLTDIQVNNQCYYDLVTIIREHKDVFPAWHSSPVAELYTPKTFQNNKKSSAYWF